jgi:hypothetical protein
MNRFELLILSDERERQARAELKKMRTELECMQAALALERFLFEQRLNIKAGFDPDQARDDLGRWTNDDGNGESSFSEVKTPSISDNLTGPGEVSQHIKDIAERNNWANPETLQRHFYEHRDDFGDKTPEDTARRTLEFRQKAIEEKLPAVKYPNSGKIAFYEPESNTFAVYGRDGKSLTSYKPDEGIKYFEDFIDTQTSRGGRIINPLPSGEGESLGGTDDIIHPKKPTHILPDDEILKHYNRLIERKYFLTTEDCAN